jgi:AcrR family transcriptional regulator
MRIPDIIVRYTVRRRRRGHQPSRSAPSRVHRRRRAALRYRDVVHAPEAESRPERGTREPPGARPLSAVAKRAGVGQGSLYRHFPDRLSLAVAVLDENVGELEEHAGLPEATLDTLLDVVIDQALVTSPFVEAILGEGDDPRVIALGTRLDRLAHALHAKELAAHRIADHVEPDDILMAISMVGATLTRIPASHRADTASRAKAMFRRSFGR